MENLLPKEPMLAQIFQTLQALRACNELTARYGLVLKEEEMQLVARQRFEALRNTGRVEFGEGILAKLIYAFCDSSYITRGNYIETILELQDSFYYFKNEAMEALSDDELLGLMAEHFNGECQGSLEYLEGTTLEELCREKREGDEFGRRF